MRLPLDERVDEEARIKGDVGGEHQPSRFEREDAPGGRQRAPRHPLSLRAREAAPARLVRTLAVARFTTTRLALVPSTLLFTTRPAFAARESLRATCPPSPTEVYICVLVPAPTEAP
jgi:hypothetical protein